MNSESNRPKDEQLLVNAAETIGSTLGSLAAKAQAATRAAANAASKALTSNDIVRRAEEVAKSLIVAGRKASASPKVKARRKSRPSRSDARTKSRAAGPGRSRTRRVPKRRSRR